jgi:hypothetical protein
MKLSTMLQSKKEQQYYPDVKNRNRQGHGSLPLKKRRFHEISRQPSPLPQQQINHNDVSKSSLVEQLIVHSSTNNINADERIAVLALVAAASSTSANGLNTGSIINSSILADTFTKPSVGIANVTAQSSSRDYKAFKSASQNQPRINHPPLSVPIPGGCHGRTSRNNSYCRRTPCYNGSKYCKLHYQHYMNDGEKNEKKGIKLLNLANDNVVYSEGEKDTNQITHRNHQDKHFNGHDSGGVRCLATTTRGRPCAYVAVSGTKYCHLHADYDINPPPRRGGSGGVTSLHKLKSDLSSDSSSSLTSSSHNDRNLRPQCLNTVTTMMSMQNLPVSAPSISSSLDKLKVNTEPIANDNMNDSMPIVAFEPHPKYPLLNSIPSDKWLNRQVLIGTGPLENHTGRVIKWGNGWVTVSTKTMLNGTSNPGSAEILHNRRAIELFLLSDETPLLESTVSLQDNVAISNAVTEVDSNRRSNFDAYIGESIAKKDKTSKIETRKVYEITPETKPLTENETGIDIEQTLIGPSEFSSKDNHSKAMEPIANSNYEKPIETNNQKESFSENLTVTKDSQNDVICDRAQNIDAVDKVEAVEYNHVSSALSKEVLASNTTCEEGNVGNFKESNDKRVSKDSKTYKRICQPNETTRDKISSLEALTTHSMNEISEKVETQYGKNLSLMEELILAQTGRRVKNVDLALYSGGGRTIQKPKRYEDRTLIMKKRNKQQSEKEEHEETAMSLKRMKGSNSPTARFPSLSSPVSLKGSR